MMDSSKPAQRLGEILLKTGIISEDQLDEALRLATERGLRTGEALVELGAIDRDKLTWALGAQFDLSYVDLQSDMVDWDFLLALPIDRLMRYRLIPMSRVQNSVTAVVADPTLDGIGSLIAELFPYDQVVVQLSSTEAIAEVFTEARRKAAESQGRLVSAGGGESARDFLRLIDEGKMTRCAVARLENDDARYLYGDGILETHAEPVSGKERDLLFEQLNADFTPSLMLAGGICALRHGDSRSGKHPVRGFQLTGPQGWIAGMKVIGTTPGNIAPASVSLLASMDAVLLKRTIFATLSGLLDHPPVMSFEACIDFLQSGFFQTEVENVQHRSMAYRYATEAFCPRLVLCEMDSAYSVIQGNWFPRGCPGTHVILYSRAPEKPDFGENLNVYIPVHHLQGEAEMAGAVRTHLGMEAGA